MQNLTLFEAFKPCKYRFGIVKNGGIYVKCKYAQELYELREAVEICNNFCPFDGGKP